jgi:tRNA 2-selenouridine synthase
MTADTIAGTSERSLFNRVRKRFRIRGSPPGSFVVFRSSGFSSGSPRSSSGAYIAVLTGLSGAGKTDLLADLAAAGEQVLDLEALASHRGSAFGGIGCGPQPSHAEFAAAVAARAAAADPWRPLWVEDAGPFIGSVGVPAWLQADIARAPSVWLHVPFDARADRLAAEYAGADSDALLAALDRSRRRLGADRADAATAHVRAGDVRTAVAVVLPWFDAAYRRRLARLAQGGARGPAR